MRMMLVIQFDPQNLEAMSALIPKEQLEQELSAFPLYPYMKTQFVPLV